MDGCRPDVDDVREEAAGAYSDRSAPTGRSLSGLAEAEAALGAFGLSALEIEAARRSAVRTNLSILETAFHLGLIDAHDRARLESALHGAPLIDLQAEPPDPALAARADRRLCVDARCVPWRAGPFGVVYAARDIGEAQDALAQTAPNARGACHIAAAAADDISKGLVNAFGPHFSLQAREGLHAHAPLRSAKRRFTRSQTIGGFVASSLIGASLYFAPFGLAFLINVFALMAFTPMLAFRLYALARAVFRPRRLIAPTRLLTDAELPSYTVLVPLLREAHMLDALTQNLMGLNYPPPKLDIKLLIEADDAETLDAARALDLPPQFEILEVPVSHPRTKPKACNYGLAFARGDYVAIFDAEDHPDPDQLLAAASTFAQSPPDIACLQAALVFYNANINWLTRQFAVEYAAHFQMILPALEDLDWPIPLGGTSNHFRVDVLRRVGAWDAYNVTEDADLGLRFAAAGYRCRLLPIATAEEATSSLGPWIRQRSRWIKGYIQTFLVSNRRPGARIRRMGWPRFIGLEIFLGGSILTHFVYPMVATVWFISCLAAGPAALLDWTTPLGPANAAMIVAGAAVSLGSAGWGAHAAGLARRSRRTALLIATAPIYRCLMGVAGALALWDLLWRPNHWRKTHHLGEELSNPPPRPGFSSFK